MKFVLNRILEHIEKRKRKRERDRDGCENNQIRLENRL